MTSRGNRNSVPAGPFTNGRVERISDWIRSAHRHEGNGQHDQPCDDHQRSDGTCGDPRPVLQCGRMIHVAMILAAESLEPSRRARSCGSKPGEDKREAKRRWARSEGRREEKIRRPGAPCAGFEGAPETALLHQCFRGAAGDLQSKSRACFESPSQSMADRPRGRCLRQPRRRFWPFLGYSPHICGFVAPDQAVASAADARVADARCLTGGGTSRSNRGQAGSGGALDLTQAKLIAPKLVQRQG